MERGLSPTCVGEGVASILVQSHGAEVQGAGLGGVLVCHASTTALETARLIFLSLSVLQMGSHIAMRVRPDLMTSSGKGTPNLLAHPGNHDCREKRGSPDQITVTSVWGVSQFRTL